MCIYCRIALISLVLEVVCFLFLFPVLLDFRVDAASSMKLEVLVLGSLFSLGLCPLIFCLVLKTSRDLFDQAREILRGLRSNGLNISLEYKKVPCLDKNVLALKRLIILLGCDNAIVDSVLAGSLVRDGALPFLLLASIVFVHGHDPRRFGVATGGFIVTISVTVRVAIGLRRTIIVDLGRF